VGRDDRRSPLLYSVGHGTRAIEALLRLLHEAGVRRLVDVRTAPGSRRNPQYAKAALARSLEDAGIAYEWRGAELGGFRRPRPDSRHTALRVDTFRGYADHMESPAFRDALSALLEEGAAEPTAFLCAEADWHRCHRRMISDAILASGGRVVHLTDRGSQEHELHPDARIEDGAVIYDGAQQTLA
jgi:uncharacterized protein (DUF488 family)